MVDLRPMEVGEVLDGTFTLYRRHFSLFLKVSVAVMWLPVAVGVYVRLHFMSGDPQQVALSMKDNVTGFVLLMFLLVVLNGIAGLLLTATSIHIISASYLGRAPSFAEALSLAGSKIVRLFLVSLGKGMLLVLIWIGGALGVVALSALGKLLGTAVAVLLGMGGGGALLWFICFVLCGYGVTTPTVVLEDLSSSFDAFGRSWELTRGFKLKVLGLASVAYLIAQIVPLGAMSVLGNFSTGQGAVAQTVAIVVSALVPILLAPIIPCVLTLLYYDLRVRREAFDLQLLGQQLGMT